MNKTQEEIENIKTKVFSMIEMGELDSAVVDYIELLQDTIENYQGELYVKNNEIGRLKFKLSAINENSVCSS